NPPLRLSNNVWQISFAPQIAQGTYNVTLGPNITDIAGNAMNQNGNGTNGEPADVFQSSVFLQDNSPPRVISVSPSGPINTNVGSLLIVFSEALLAGTFTTADVAFTGPVGPISSLSLNQSNSTTWSLAFPTQTNQGLYLVTIGPAIQDTVGNSMTSAATSSFTIDFVGPRVTNMTPSGGITQAVSFVDIAFNEAIQPTSLTSTDVTLSGPSGSISVSYLSTLSTNKFRIGFPTQTSSGIYSVSVGPDVLDLAGNPMNQDGDATNGESGQDIFNGQFIISTP